ILPSEEAGTAGDAQMIDLKGGYLMPGLWDVHIHPDYLSLDEIPLADQVTLFGHRLAAALTESGIVGLRCAGAHQFMDVAWKRAFDSGQHVGPRLFASGYFLTTTGGRLRCAAAPRQPRTCMLRGSAKRSMPVCEWHWAPTSALSRTPRCLRWGCGRRRRARLLEGHRGGVSRRPAPAVLGSQDRQ